MKQSGISSTRCTDKRGFALIVALVLMGFMLLLIISISTLLQVELASTTHSKNLLLARQNAYMGMLTALGELQKIAGPDARVTARSDIFLEPGGLNASQLEQPYWLGIWNSKNADDTVKQAQDYQDWDSLTAEQKIAQAYWIVSGNEGVAPDNPDYLTPLKALVENDSVILAGAAEDYDVEAVRVKKVVVEGVGESGHYAYWVSGDNSKALVNVVDTDASTSNDPKTLNRSFQIANRTGVGAVAGLDKFSPDDLWLDRIMDLSSGYINWKSDDVEDLSAIRRARFHDLTAWSKGLLVDVKDGALKRDLTQAFEIYTSFEEHFQDQAFTNQEASDEAAADPTTPEPYNFVADPVVVSGSPNWAILRDYYQHYWPASSWSKLKDDYLNFRGAYKKVDGKSSEEAMFTPHWHNGTRKSDPYVSSGLPYQYTSETSYTNGDNYQASSLITPVVAQIRLTYAFELVPGMDGAKVPVITFKPVYTLYNPYNTNMGANDFGFVSTLSPKITLELFFVDGTKVVEFYQAELHNANKQGTLKVSLGSFNIGPGTLVHEAFIGSPFGKVESNSGANADYVKPNWTAVGGLRFPLDKVDETNTPDPASTSGAVSLAEARASGVKEPSWHAKWGISTEEKEWLRQAIAVDAPITIKIEYENFGIMRSWTNSSAAGQSYNNIVDLWEADSNDQPDNFKTSFVSMTAAGLQDSFETLVFSLRTTERMGGFESETDSLRNLIDNNYRAIFSNSRWDGGNGKSRYLSLYDVESLGQNEQEPESYTDPDNGVKYGYWGNSIESTGQASVVLFERPRGRLMSLGQLQHANLGRYQFDPTYIVGNSYANLRIPMDQTRVTNFDNVSGLTYFDVPYLANERIWDGFFFSTLEIPRTAEGRETLAATLDDPGVSLSDHILNPRMEFITSDISDSDRYNRIVVEDIADENFKSAIYRPASEMWINGAFNVNSTSVEAWKAVLASSQNLRFPVYDPSGTNEIVTESDVAFSRVSRPYSRGFKASDEATEAEFWKGYRLLTSAELDDLAESIVEQVRARGPFLSLASFVNRRLSTDEFSKKGALQAALDDPSLGGDTSLAVNVINNPNVAGEAVTAFRDFRNFLPENLSSTDRSNMGFPGYVLQGDILQQIGSFLTVRSDTFTIRAYGDVINPITKEVTSQVWCEAKVQRTPEAMPGVAQDASEMDELIQPSSTYGRRFEVVSFRWLESDEI
ncbi:hypothetical protein ACFFOV_09560 [Cerasicoccus arenae]|nr:hypothetical protein [Cerasicoccus arenae]